MFWNISWQYLLFFKLFSQTVILNLRFINSSFSHITLKSVLNEHVVILKLICAVLQTISSYSCFGSLKIIFPSFQKISFSNLYFIRNTTNRYSKGLKKCILKSIYALFQSVLLNSYLSSSCCSKFKVNYFR